jgi:hypothetical protein
VASSWELPVNIVPWPGNEVDTAIDITQLLILITGVALVGND